MLVFLDTEFTDFVDCELISIGMVSEDGRHEFYLEVQDFDRSTCSDFVQSTVWSCLGRINGVVVRKTEVQCRLREWFATLPSSVMIACDSNYDRYLLATAFDGDWPVNFAGWADLLPLIDTEPFNTAVIRYHTLDKPRHHALHDAHAHRAGWIAWVAESN